jgi:hypothetical protein
MYWDDLRDGDNTTRDGNHLLKSLILKCQSRKKVVEIGTEYRYRNMFTEITVIWIWTTKPVLIRILHLSNLRNFT